MTNRLFGLSILVNVLVTNQSRVLQTPLKMDMDLKISLVLHLHEKQRCHIVRTVPTFIRKIVETWQQSIPRNTLPRFRNTKSLYVAKVI